MAGLKALSAELSQIRKQLPFASALALTRVARRIEQAQKKTIERKLDNPAPFTVRGVGSAGAGKNNLSAKVFVRDIAAGYLTPFEAGGVHKLNSRALLNPKNTRLNKYGNLPRSRLRQLRAKPDVFIGKVKGVNGFWQRQKAKKTAKGRKRRKRSAPGIRRARPKQRPPGLLIRFGDALSVTPVLDWQKRAREMATALMPGELSRAVAQAMQTAK